MAVAENEDGTEKKVFNVVPSEAREEAIAERASSLRAAAAEAKMVEEQPEQPAVKGKAVA